MRMKLGMLFIRAAGYVTAGVTPGWAAALPGVTVIDESPGTTRLALQDGADDQAILHAALEAGPVHEFSRARPSLTDLFRHIVSIEDQP